MKKIILLAVEGDTTWMLINHLRREGISITHIVLENPISKVQLVKRRVKKLGMATVFGQLVFQLGIVPMLRHLARKRIQEILKEYHCYTNPPASVAVKQVTSVNNESTIQWLQDQQPDLILVNGTRILSKKILQSVQVPFINTHLGITPAYRGVHGGYWSLYKNDRSHFGSTIHLVDAGIDTGGILKQVLVQPSDKDNFCSYPYLQMAASLSEISRIVQNESFVPNKPDNTLPSALYYHPTCWQYIRGFFRGVR